MTKWLRVVWNNTDNIAKWVQILALGIAAYWAYTRFLTGEAPSLEPRVGARAEYGTYPGPTEGTCHFQAHIFVSNEGKTSFDIKTVHLEVFRSALPTATPAIEAPFDENSFERKENLVFGNDLALPSLLHHYAPGQQSDQTVSWIIEKQPNQVYLFKIKAGASDKYGRTPFATARYWEWGICPGSRDNTGAKQSP
jgi:hypothetical protein